MENKAVCYYCGTIYDAERGKCPLCGSSAHEEERAQPQRRRPVEQARTRQRDVREKPVVEKKESVPQEKIPKGLLKTALAFLVLSVLVLLFFIGDMIGWWPGLENLVDRSNLTTTVKVETSCTLLRLEPQTIEIAGVGQSQQMVVAVNLHCEDKVYCTSADESIVSIAETAQTALGVEEKTVTFTLTGVAEGETTITVKCGNRQEVCTVVCGDPTAVVPTVAPDYEPLLSCGDELRLTSQGQTVLLLVENLPDGFRAEWSSSDESVVKVDEQGIVSAVTSGTAVIRAGVGGKTAEVVVQCDFGEAETGAHLQYEDVTISVGETFYLHLYDSKGERITGLTYSVEDAAVCEVNNGAVVGRARGTTNVNITYQGEKFTCIVRVTN